MNRIIPVDLKEKPGLETVHHINAQLANGHTALISTDLRVDCNRRKVITNPDHPNSAVIRIR